jgi:hypothetical protein
MKKAKAASSSPLRKSEAAASSLVEEKAKAAALVATSLRVPAVEKNATDPGLRNRALSKLVVSNGSPKIVRCSHYTKRFLLHRRRGRLPQ